MPQGMAHIKFFTSEKFLVLEHLQRDFYPHHPLKHHNNLERWAEQEIYPFLR